MDTGRPHREPQDGHLVTELGGLRGVPGGTRAGYCTPQPQGGAPSAPREHPSASVHLGTGPAPGKARSRSWDAGVHRAPRAGAARS